MDGGLVALNTSLRRSEFGATIRRLSRGLSSVKLCVASWTWQLTIGSGLIFRVGGEKLFGEATAVSIV
ncbi:hypothetical protein RM61_22120 [Xanthomonas phaseoli pv. phaseoli]|nr:hypothetical protein RM61_22120 [Xanthomonas phaseoli pv. phaseoli]